MLLHSTHAALDCDLVTYLACLPKEATQATQQQALATLMMLLPHHHLHTQADARQEDAHMSGMECSTK